MNLSKSPSHDLGKIVLVDTEGFLGFTPVDQRSHKLGTVTHCREFKGFEALLRSQESHTLSRKMRRSTFLRSCSDVTPRSPVDTDRRESARATIVGQGIHEAFGRGVIRLTRSSKQGCSRREHDEEIEFKAGSQFMQCPCAFYLRGHDLGEFCRVLLQYHGVG